MAERRDLTSWRRFPAWVAALVCPVLAASCASPTQAVSLECPAAVRVRADVVSPAAPWRAVPAETEHRLESAGFSDGPADEKAFLKPDSAELVKQVRTVTWSFGGGGSDTVWLGCSYQGTPASVTRKVDGTLTQCVVTYDEVPGQPPAVKAISCQASGGAR